MILVTGAHGVVGQPLCDRLSRSGQRYLRVSRRPSSEFVNVSLKWDLEQPLSAAQLQQIAACHTLIHCAPIWLLPIHVEQLAKIGIRRMVVFSSTSVIAKQASQNSSERVLVAQLADAEHALRDHAQQGQFELTIFRPSMIYGYGLDQNISHIARRLQRLPFMPVAGPAAGLRQPVHADDLVAAALTVLDLSESFGQTYNLAGGERLSYRSMIERIFMALGRSPRTISVPVWAYRCALQIASWLGRFNYTADMANRMNQDLVYDNSEAQQDFGFKPQAFLDQPERDLPMREGGS